MHKVRVMRPLRRTSECNEKFPDKEYERRYRHRRLICTRKNCRLIVSLRMWLMRLVMRLRRMSMLYTLILKLMLNTSRSLLKCTIVLRRSLCLIGIVFLCRLSSGRTMRLRLVGFMVVGGCLKVRSLRRLRLLVSWWIFICAKVVTRVLRRSRPFCLRLCLATCTLYTRSCLLLKVLLCLLTSRLMLLR